MAIDISEVGRGLRSTPAANGVAALPSKTRFAVLAASFVLSLLCLPGLAVGKPNVLLICVDDLKPALGCYGDPLAKTPNLDRLAARGMRFDLAYCNQAVCAPSRNGLMLGSRSTSIGIYSLGEHFRQAVPDAVSLPRWMM